MAGMRRDSRGTGVNFTFNHGIGTLKDVTFTGVGLSSRKPKPNSDRRAATCGPLSFFLSFLKVS